MIGIDTNVLVRYVAQDETTQAHKATQLIESFTSESPGYVGLVTVIELVWVLMGCYSCSRENIVEVVELLLRTKELLVADAETLWSALRVFKSSKADFADCVIERVAHSAGCDYTVTFDRGAAKYCGMHLIS